MKNKNANKGFTLVELAIVLVIIGLLVGGVLQGQELIEQAKIRSVLRSVNEMDTAVNTFNAKYAGIPGDFSRATQFGVDRAPGASTSNLAYTKTVSGTQLGDGDGDHILQDGNDTGGSTYNITVFRGETANFWVMLSNAQLVKGNFTQPRLCTGTSGAARTGDAGGTGTPCNGHVGEAFPAMPIGIGMIALTDIGFADGQLNYVMGLDSSGPIGIFVSTFSGTMASAAVRNGFTLTPEQVYSVDSKLDDGFPGTGSVSSFYSYSTDGTLSGQTGMFVDDTPTGTTISQCVTSSGGRNIYALTKKDKVCTMRIRASA